MKTVSSIKKGLLFFGAFIIAVNLAILLHELCHATAAWITGGNVYGIMINPFSRSYSYSNSPYPLFHTAAGPFGSSLLALILFIILFRWPKLWLLPLLLMGSLSFIGNGGYLLADTLLRSGGDACSLIDRGIPAFVLLALGALLLITGLILAFLLIKRTGLLDDAFKGRLVTLAMGIMPYILAGLIWNYIYNRSEIMLRLPYAASKTVLTLFFAAISRQTQTKDLKQPYFVSWKVVTGINLAAVALVIFILVGPLSQNPWNMEVFSERPDDYPAVLTSPPDAINPRYSHQTLPPREYYYLNYELLESTPPDEIRPFLANLHKKHGYTLLLHSINDPNQVHNDKWEEKTEMIDQDPILFKSYRQNWMKINSGVSISHLYVLYLWNNSKFRLASVIHYVTDNEPVERILDYAAQNPEEFDPNQLEQIENLRSPPLKNIAPQTDKLET